MVLFGKSPEELQHSLDLLETFCDSWSLEVNISKTKGMVCRKSGQIHEHEKWIFKGKQKKPEKLCKHRIKSVKCVVK